MSANHHWKFFRAGGFDQVRLETGADLINLDKLDLKLWVALACPTTGIEFDPKTAALIDTDKDGRIRASELLTAVKWAAAQLKNPDVLIKGGDSLALTEINDSTPEGAQLHASANQILANLSKTGPAVISLEDVSDAGRIFANTVLNGDGIIIPDSATEPETKKVVGEIMDCFGSAVDRSGKLGIDQARADLFFADAGAYESWIKQSETDAATVLPLGDQTAVAVAAINAIKCKVDDYFGRCRLAAFDARAAGMVNRKEEDYQAIVSKNLSINVAEAADFPLAHIAPGKPLPLSGAVNPAHADAVGALRLLAVKPALGDRDVLTEADWMALQSKLGAFEAWQASKAGAAVEKLGVARIRAILAGKAREEINSLIANDKALEAQATAIANVEKLLRFVRDLNLLCINFVNFKDLYDGGEPAIFQCGTLYLDQRSCTLCLTVEDAGRHATMAGLAGAYLAYCDCVRKGTGEKMSIVAIFSQGDEDNLMVGRNGVFYDRKGRDYDATITKILPNPISIRQAFWSPYKKLVRMIEEQIAKRAAAADADANLKLANTAQKVAAAEKQQADQKAEQKKVDVGVVAALGVAFSAAGTAAAYFLGLFKGIAPWQLPLIVLGLMLLVSGPSMIIAFMKLRKRNLGPILDANGWAVNGKAKVNVPLGTSLTGIAKLPPGATVDLGDKFAQKTSVLPKLLFVLFLVWWAHSYLYDEGWLYKWTQGSYGHQSAYQIEQAKLKQEKEKAAGSPESAAPAAPVTPTTNAAAAAAK